LPSRLLLSLTPFVRSAIPRTPLRARCSFYSRYMIACARHRTRVGCEGPELRRFDFGGRAILDLDTTLGHSERDKGHLFGIPGVTGRVHAAGGVGAFLGRELHARISPGVAVEELDETVLDADRFREHEPAEI